MNQPTGEPARAGQARPHAMVISADGDGRALVEAIRSRGLDVDLVPRRSRALGLLRSGLRPDLVFFDWSVGLGFVGEVRAISERTEVIAVQHAPSAQHLRDALAAGALEVVAQPVDDAELERVFAALRARVDGFRALLDGMSVVDVLQVLHQGRRTTRIQIGQTAEICMRDGEVVHARTALSEGLEAFADLIARPAGTLRTSPLVDCPQTIERPFQHLLLDTLTRRDEAAEAARRERLVEHAFEVATGPIAQLVGAAAPQAGAVPPPPPAPVEAIEAIEVGAVDPPSVHVVRAPLAPPPTREGRGRQGAGRRLALAILLLVVGGVIGWATRSQSQPPVESSAGAPADPPSAEATAGAPADDSPTAVESVAAARPVGELGARGAEPGLLPPSPAPRAATQASATGVPHH